MLGDDFPMRVLEAIAAADLHSSLFWRTDGEYAPVSFFIDCSDVFSWGSADATPLTPESFDRFERALHDARHAIDGSAAAEYEGAMLFCARERQERPQGAAYPRDRRLWPLFDDCGPERPTGLGNPYVPGQRGLGQ